MERGRREDDRVRQVESEQRGSQVAGRDIDLNALGGYLCLNYVPGDATLLRGVRRLPPASWRKYSATGAVTTGRYWNARGSHPQPAMSDDDRLDALQDRLDDAARIALRSDVPVGIFLSGGVDSSLVAQSAARLGKLKAKTAFSEPRLTDDTNNTSLVLHRAS